MDIRLLHEEDDRSAVSEIYEESWKYAYQDIVPKAYLESIPKGRWASALDAAGIFSLLMLENDRMIGTASYGGSRAADMENYGEIISIYFLPEFIGKGYGERLLQSVLEGLRAMGFCDVYLWVLEENARARRFYEKLGFEANGKSMTLQIGGKDLTELQYCRHIA